MKQRTIVGFTMVELLVVISIISILSAVIYASFSGARIDASNKAIQTHMKETQLAIELYKAQNGQYPDTSASAAPGCVVTGFGVKTARSSICGSDPLIAGMSDFIAELPQDGDSQNPNCEYIYEIPTDRSWYKLTAVNCHMAPNGASDGVKQTNELARCPSTCSLFGVCANPTTAASFYESYAVYSPGGECR